MFVFLKIMLLVVITLGAYLTNYILRVLQPELPQLCETWWSLKHPENKSSEIKPFTINVTDKVLEDLEYRLRATRPLTPSYLDTPQNKYGVSDKIINELKTFWIEEYNWREREKYLNKYPQYTVSIQGLKIHYVHAKAQNAEGKRVLPILLMHGWPGSVSEFYKLIPFIIEPRPDFDFVFEVVVPSLPGYGFSEGAAFSGLGPGQIAVIFKNLMTRLGYQRFYLHGGDWGTAIAQIMMAYFPEKTAGFHSTMCTTLTPMSTVKLIVGSVFPSLVIDKQNQHRMYPLVTRVRYFIEEFGYFHLQSTKPDSLGVALSDSPIGLAAYILQKFVYFSNHTYGLEESFGLKEKYSYESLLDNIMLYWLTNSITTSMRLYAEFYNQLPQMSIIVRRPTEVPTACIRFSHDISYLPDALLKDKFPNLIHTHDYEGGHYPAMEQPSVLADDIFIAIDKMEHFAENRKRVE